MKVELFTPTNRLASIINSFTIIETESMMETTVLPHKGLVLALQLSGKVFFKNQHQTISISPVTISGQRNTFRSFIYSPNTTTILVSFTETGAYSIFGETVFELYENAESLENLLPSHKSNELLDKLYHAKSNLDRVRLIELFLTSQICRTEIDKLVLSSLEIIQCKKGIYKISKLSSDLGISQDAFEKRFRKVVGSTPKQFSTVVKMKEVIKQKNNHRLLTQLGYSFDFFDQSHFIKQFKDFTGQTPKQFFKQPYHW